MINRTRQLFRSRLSVLLAIAFGALWPNTAIADDTVFASPATAWEIEYSDDHCGLKRHFAQGNNILSLELRQYAPGNGTEAALLSNSLDRRGRTPVTRLGQHGKNTEHETFAKLRAGEWQGVRVWLADGYFDPARADSGASQWLYFGNALEREVALELGGLTGAMQALDTCVDDLVAGWGLDPAEQRSLSRKIPEESVDWDEIFSFVDSAIGLSAMIEAGVTRVLFLVGADGRATSCKVLGLTIEPEREEKACETFRRRVEFEPALDSVGNPVASFVLTQTSVVRRLSYLGIPRS